ncbi:putative RDD family membrane protein YckC [Catenulispora sp. GAS73]|uniref:RDD family protein n=1 Tax=Catenulispora sp. GAS73 TaxID=3156269 RepID=UPI0035124304
MSDLVIGEGVALDLRLAKLPSRALARLLDLLIQASLLGVLAAVLGVVASAGAVDDAVMAGLMIVVTIAAVVGYPALLETVGRGRTLGKMALGLRVVRTDGGPVRFRHALVRALSGIFDLYATAGVLAVATSFSSKQGRRTGDWLAGTVVVRDRAPDAGVSPAGMAALAMPYPLLGWAQQLDLSALPDDVALSARQYLTRMHEMRPDVAARMGHEVATEVLRYVAMPPAGTPPWAYLAAVTAERRVRQMRAAEAAQRAAWERAQRQAPAYAGAPGPTAGAPAGAPPMAPPTAPPPAAWQGSMVPPVQDRTPETQPAPQTEGDGFKPPL